MGRRLPKVYCCSKMKGRKGQAYASNTTNHLLEGFTVKVSVAVWEVLSLITNITPGASPTTLHLKKQQVFRLSVSRWIEVLFRGAKKSVVKRRSKIWVIVKTLQGHCIRLIHYKGLKKNPPCDTWPEQTKVSLTPLDWRAPGRGFPCALHLYSHQPQDWGSLHTAI